MKLVDRQTFLAYPDNTVFQKYRDLSFGELCIKVKTFPEGVGDFVYIDLNDSIDCCDDVDRTYQLLFAYAHDRRININFTTTTRDGLFDENQLFAVWEKSDVVDLVQQLMHCLFENPQYK
jgi:hypothetical protein